MGTDSAGPLGPPEAGRSGGLRGRIEAALEQLLADVPPSSEAPPGEAPAGGGPAGGPAERARALTRRAAVRSAVLSGTMALPAGPLGIVTVLPDLLAIWNVQKQLVADIAAVHGKTAQLGREAMAWCLFRHAAGQVLRDVIVRAGGRYLVRRSSVGALQRLLGRLGLVVSQRVVGRTVSRWLPLVGAAGAGAYAYYDTLQVGRTAAALFGAEITEVLETDSTVIVDPDLTEIVDIDERA